MSLVRFDLSIVTVKQFTVSQWSSRSLVVSFARFRQLVVCTVPVTVDYYNYSVAYVQS